MKDYSIKPGKCRMCLAQRRFILHMQLNQSGVRMYCWVCEACKIKNPGGERGMWISPQTIAKYFTTDQVDALPTILPDLCCRCSVCGSRDVQLHHWAPKGIFGKDAEKWPKDYLCNACHREWHEKVTPQLVKEEFRQ